MKPSFVIYLLLLSFFLTLAQGIRLEKGSFAAQQHKQNDQESNLLKTINSAAKKDATLCEDEQYCAGKIKCKKLVITSSTSTNQDISKNVKNEGNESEVPEMYNSRKFKVNWEGKEIFVNKEEEVSDEYVDLVDIAGMDYSPPKKNPPIHN